MLIVGLTSSACAKEIDTPEQVVRKYFKAIQDLDIKTMEEICMDIHGWGGLEYMGRVKQSYIEVGYFPDEIVKAETKMSNYRDENNKLIEKAEVQLLFKNGEKPRRFLIKVNGKWKIE